MPAGNSFSSRLYFLHVARDVDSVSASVSAAIYIAVSPIDVLLLLVPFKINRLESLRFLSLKVRLADERATRLLHGGSSDGILRIKRRVMVCCIREKYTAWWQRTCVAGCQVLETSCVHVRRPPTAPAGHHDDARPNASFWHRDPVAASALQFIFRKHSAEWLLNEQQQKNKRIRRRRNILVWFCVL